jgi:DNA (cytosine-5)-methyltransferase 1
MSLRILDLFCGAGGFSSGFKNVSGTHLAIDNDPIALETYRFNYPDFITLNQDISSLHSLEIEKRLGKPDIVIASPPCEEFSLANPRSESPAAERIYGNGTARLFLDAVRIISDLQPSVFVIENVAAILKSGGREIIRMELEDAGLTPVYFNMVRAHKYGNPSKRLRVFISNMKMKLPKASAKTVIEVIGDLPPKGIDALFTINEDVPNHYCPVLTDEKLRRVMKTSWRHGAKYFRVSKKRALPNWVRLAPDQIATSIIGLARYIHPYEHRLLTVREHARLMSYPDDFIFIGHLNSQYNQVGESVPPIISKLIAQEVLSTIE